FAVGGVELLWMLRVPVRAKRAAGVNVTLMTQAPPGASAFPQVLVWAKSPVTVTPEMAKGILPVFVTVTACTALVVPTSWLLKLSAAGVTAAVATPPVPVRLAVSVVLPVGTLREPLRRPPEEGVNVTCSVQLAPVANTEEQLLVWPKSPAVEMEPTV